MRGRRRFRDLTEGFTAEHRRLVEAKKFDWRGTPCRHWRRSGQAVFRIGNRRAEALAIG